MTETLLLASLGEYSEQLTGHLAVLRERHQELEIAWARLHEIYEGEGAQIFGEAFTAASARLADYTSGSELIARQLHNKIEELRAFEASDSAL
jgi:hypothetical protein